MKMKRTMLLTFLLTNDLFLSSCDLFSMTNKRGNKDEDNSGNISSNINDGSFSYRKKYNLGEEITHGDFVDLFRHMDKNPNNHVIMNKLCDGVWADDTITAEATYSYNMWETENPKLDSMYFDGLVLKETDISYIQLLYDLDSVDIAFYRNRTEQTFSYVYYDNGAYSPIYGQYILNENFEVIYSQYSMGNSHEDIIATWSSIDLGQDRPIRVKDRTFAGTDVYETNYFDYDRCVLAAQNINIDFDKKGHFQMYENPVLADGSEADYAYTYYGTYRQEEDQLVATAEYKFVSSDENVLEDGETLDIVFQIKKSKLLMEYEVRSSEGNKMHIHLVLEYLYEYQDTIDMPGYYEE